MEYIKLIDDWMNEWMSEWENSRTVENFEKLNRFK